jgi:hypothetical protein
MAVHNYFYQFFDQQRHVARTRLDLYLECPVQFASLPAASVDHCAAILQQTEAGHSTIRE